MNTELNTELKLSAPKTVTTKRALSWYKLKPVEGRTPVEIPAGTSIQVCFSEVRPSRLYVMHETGQKLALRLDLASLSVTGFAKRPGTRALEKYAYDSVCKTPTGHEVEPDGTGPDGSPSWLLVLGLI